QAAWALGVHEGRLDPARPPAWQGAAAQVIEADEEERLVGAAVRQQYTAVREETHPGAFGERAPL
ncbi:sugar kinase, partial [Streptomyces sp. NEAU-H3]|nr:sugar kinase [Streptomyces sp. NEAU-H3]